MRPHALPLAASLLLATIGFAHASDANFTLKNKTGYQIDEVYVSRHSSDNWGRDRMGSDALADGDSVDIVFPHGGSACRFDIKVKYHDDDSTAEWGDVNLCQYESISLFWDAKKQVTRAVGE
ncbi:MAG: argininosuccinate lyase [Acetobacteraceae bacterium]